MAYQAGVATGPNNLLQSLVSFLTANGYTNNMSQADGAGWRAHLNVGSVFVNLRAAQNEGPWTADNFSSAGYSLNLYLGTAFASGNGWAAQAGGPIASADTDTVGVAAHLLNGSVASHHFFVDGTGNVIVVVERTAGIYGYFGWGTSLNKMGATWTGGPYFFGSLGHFHGSVTAAGGNWAGFEVSAGPPMSGPYRSTVTSQLHATSYIRADVDAFTGLWTSLQCSTTDPDQHGYTGGLHYSSARSRHVGIGLSGSVGEDDRLPHFNGINDRTTAVINNQAVLLPVYQWALRGGTNFGLLGIADSIYASNAVGNGYAAGDTVTIAGATYMLFPHFAVRRIP